MSASASSSTSFDYSLFYWKVPGRACLPYVLLRSSGFRVNFNDEDSNEEKNTYKQLATFGQLPYLIDHKNQNLSLAQSAAIAIYCSRVTQLDGGADLKTYAQVLEYIELEAELTQFIGRALYTGEKGSEERKKAWVDAKGKIDLKLKRVTENLGKNQWLGGGSAPTGADYALATVFWLLSLPTLYPEFNSEYPALKNHFDRLKTMNEAAAATYAEMDKWEMYYVRE